MKPKVSIIILRYQEKEKLFNCLATIKQSKPKVQFEAIVVDNNSRKPIGDALRRKSPKVKYVKSAGNIGYGAGNNLGAKSARGEYLLILNPDTKVLPGAIDELVKFLEKNKKAAVVAPNLTDAQGNLSLQIGSAELTPLRGMVALSFLNKLFPNNPISRKYWLKSLPKDKEREVGVVPGSAFLVRKEVFERVRGFDENFFLYFEESDFCKRVKENGFKIFIIPQAQVVHYWQPAEGTEATKEIFSQSRFYYFKKHYGYFSALLVEAFARFSKWHVALLIMVALGVFLRFFRIEENLVFHGEIGHNYLAIKNFIQNKQIPLIGPPTSHPWLSFGPLFYWLFGPFLAFAGYNPVSGAYFMAVAGILVIILNYFVIGRLFDKRVALLSSFLIAVSPAWVGLAREARFFSLVVLFFYPFFYSFVKSIGANVSAGQRARYFFWAGLFFGLMLNFHLTPLIFVPAILTLIYLKRKDLKRESLIKGLVGFLIPNIPFLLDNAAHRFEMLTKLIVWVPYRMVGFFGLYPKNTASTAIIKQNLTSLYNFFGRNFLPEKNVFTLALFLTVIVFLTIEVKKGLVKKRWNLAFLATLLIFAWGYLGIFIHGAPPSHYYLPLLPLPILFLSLLLVRVWQKYGAWVIVVFLTALTIINFRHFFSAKWFFRPEDKIVNLFVPYNLQLKAAKAIIADADQEPFSLSRVGPFDEFEGDYAQNYQYLLWWLGNEPVEKASLRYTIYEDIVKLPEGDGKQIFWQGNIVILKEGR